MTWLASKVIGNSTPSSDENDVMGESVPEDKMIHRLLVPNSEKTYTVGIEKIR